MVQVDFDSLQERDAAIDLESGTISLANEEEVHSDHSPQNFLSRAWSGFVGSENSIKNQEDTNLRDDHSKSIECPVENGDEVSPFQKKNVGGEKHKMKSCKKPPRPPRAPSLDAADQKLIKEIADLAMLKRARIERMKALKRMKNSKSEASKSNLFALIITVIFCIVIVWQGFFPRGSSSASFQGSPVSSVGARGGFISVQFYKNVSTNHDSTSSPNNVELTFGLDDHGGVSRGMDYSGYTLKRI